MCGWGMYSGSVAGATMIFVKLAFTVIFFFCLVLMLARQREMLQVLKEIRDKK